jgi:hypothetical protein
MTAAKAWVALLALILASVMSSDIVPTTGNWHTVLSVLSIIVGAVATYLVPNKPTVQNESEK